MLNTATYGWEVVMVDVDKFDPELETRTFKNDVKQAGSDAYAQYEVYRKTIVRDENGDPIKDENGKLQYIDEDGVDGKALILQKLDMARNWMKTSFGLDLDQLRKEVQTRQYLTDEKGEFVLRDGKFVNRLVEPLHIGSSETLMDSLLYQVDKFKELQN